MKKKIYFTICRAIKRDTFLFESFVNHIMNVFMYQKEEWTSRINKKREIKRKNEQRERGREKNSREIQIEKKTQKNSLISTSRTLVL